MAIMEWPQYEATFKAKRPLNEVKGEKTDQAGRIDGLHYAAFCWLKWRGHQKHF